MFLGTLNKILESKDIAICHGHLETCGDDSKTKENKRLSANYND